MLRGKFGFTLAEVLIALAVIGVVVLLVVPGLIFDYKVRVTVTQLKKICLTESEIVERAIMEHGVIEHWGTIAADAASAKMIAEKLMKYLKVVESCVGDDECKNYPIEQIAYLYETSDVLNLMVERAPFYRIVLNNGTVYIVRPTGGCSNTVSCFDTFVDLNGKSGPNTFGRDFLFLGHVYSNGNHDFGYSLWDPSDLSGYGCNPKRGEGWGCTAWIFYNENMDYLRCADELSWDGKTSCK